MHGKAFAYIEVAGAPLPESIMASLEAVVVENALNLPDTFAASFIDPQGSLVSGFAGDLGRAVKISVNYAGEVSRATIMEGELTAVEVDFDPEGTRTVVRGMDVTYRLQAGRKTRTWSHVTASDVARSIAGTAGLAAGTIDATVTTYEHVAQADMTDLEFLTRLGAENDRAVIVSEGKLHFRQQPDATAAPAPGRLNAPAPDPLKLVLHGDQVRSLRATVRSAGQVKEVVVRGWDPKTKRVVVGTAGARTTAAVSGTGPADLARRAGDATYVSVTTPFTQASEANAAARDMADHLASTFTEMEGSILGHPGLTAGSTVNISNLGSPLDGKFKVSSVTHRLDRRGYETSFVISGQQDRTLMGLVAGGVGGAQDGRFPGVVPAIVTDNNDPEEQGRVKVKLPWLDDHYESDWCRMVQFGAGRDRGALFLPEVDDEVLVAFEQGDLRRPVVIGSLYNGPDRPVTGRSLVSSGTGVSRRGVVSKRGSMLVFFDEPAKEGVALLSSDKGLKVSLNKTKTTIHVASNGEVTIEGTRKVTIDGGQELVLTGQKVVVGSGTTTSVEVQGVQVEVQGTKVDLKAKASASVSAPQVSLG